MPKVIFILQDGLAKTVKADCGMTIMRVAQINDIDIEGACEGSMACSTCHVILDKDWFAKLDPASEEEEDMLDLAPGLSVYSRLGCQVEVNNNLDGMIVSLPSTTVNLMES